MLTVSAQNWTPAIDWVSKAAGSVGLRLTEAFTAFSAAINAIPGNAGVPLQLVKDHSAATGTTNYGYIWRLGHPVNPYLLRFYNTSKSQGSSASSSTASFTLALESDYSDDGTFGGYGQFTSTLASVSAGMSYYGTSGTPAFNADGRLIVLMDTTPGAEFFCYNIATTSGDIYAQNHTLMLFRGAVSSGWNVGMLRSQALAGMFESRNFYCWSNNVLQASSTYPITPSGLEQMLVTGVGLIPSGFGPGQMFAYGTKQERLPFPSVFWFGSNQITDPRRLGRVSNPGGPGTFYQLGAAINTGGMDCWVLVPPSTPAMAGWNTIGSLSSLQTMPDRLYFCPASQPGPVLMGPVLGPDFLTDWSPVAMGAPGVAQHPFYAQQEGEGERGRRRPSTGVLWPRGMA